MAHTFTQHAEVRIRQRGICKDAISFIEKYGEVKYAPGGVKRVTLLKKKRDQIIRALKKAIDLVEKAAKLEVIQSEDKIITVYYK